MDTISDLMRRIDALEAEAHASRRSARRSRAGMLALGAAGAAVLLCAAAAPQRGVEDVVQTRHLEILDEAGHLVLRASGTAQGGLLDIWNTEGRNILRLTGNEFGGDMAIWNTQGGNVAGAFATAAGGEFSVWNGAGARVLRAHGSEEGGRLDLHNRRDQAIWSASVSDGGGRLSVANPGGQSGVSLQAGEWGGQLLVNNAHGAPALTAEATQQGTGLLHVADSAGQPRYTAEVTAGGGVSRLIATSGRNLATLGASDDQGGGGLRLFNPEGAAVLEGQCTPEGCGVLAVATENGQSVFTVTGLREIGATVEMSSSAGKKTFLLATRASGAIMNLFNAYGSPTVAVGPAPSGRSGAISVMNERGVQVVSLTAAEDESGEVRVWDPDGRKERGTLPTKRSVLDRP